MIDEGAVFISTAGEKLLKRKCIACGGRLTVHQGLGTGVCDKPECRQQMIAKVGAEMISRHRRLREEEIEDLFDHMSEQVTELKDKIGAGDATMVVRSVVPFQADRLVPLPEERRADFEKNLRETVAKSFDNEMTRIPDMKRRRQLEEPHHVVMDTACITCQGWCCKTGGNKAYISRVDIDQWRIKNPEDGPEDIIDFYMSQLPEESVEDHCVFQGPMGCVMDRSVRANICNNHFCSGLRKAEKGLHESDTGHVIYIARDEDMVPRKMMGWSPATGIMQVDIPEELQVVVDSPEQGAQNKQDSMSVNADG